LVCREAETQLGVNKTSLINFTRKKTDKKDPEQDPNPKKPEKLDFDEMGAEKQKEEGPLIEMSQAEKFLKDFPELDADEGKVFYFLHKYRSIFPNGHKDRERMDACA